MWIVSAWSGYPPSVREVAARAGDPLATTYDALERLRDLGLVAWEPRKERTLHSTMRVVR